jgi:hypothetical protein
VILEKYNETFCSEIKRLRAACLLLPLVPLPLIQEAVFRGGDELLRAPPIVGVIGLVVPDVRDHGAVMKVVIPESVQAIATVSRRAQKPGVLHLVFSDDERKTTARGGSDPPDERREAPTRNPRPVSSPTVLGCLRWQ